MHLKRVEMENFKSFGKKLSIPFLDGFTAITGPNGSGKSNIGDAVLFVLGPKSNKAIRAGKLTDLIFNGGKERKPADHCRVSLVFDNVDRVIPVDADEVSLTRLVKLSKSDRDNYYSYFYVNGRASSLGEFDELLAKARISAEGYNIVRQGDILKIVEMTPLQRRGIVDEIAGITRFDADIEKANKERTAVEANLERVRIILAEIDAQLATLAREREAALKFKAVKDELDLTKAKHGVRRRQNLESDLANVHQLIDSERHALEQMQGELTTLATRLTEVQAGVSQVEAKILERAGPEAQELKRKIEEIKRVAVQAEERLNYAQGEIADLKRERGDVGGDLKRQEKELVKYAKERDAVAAKRDEAAGELAQREEALAKLRDRISHSTGRASDLQRELAELKLRHEKAEVQLHEARLAMERAQDRRARLRGALAENEEQQETHKFELKDVQFAQRELADGGDGGSTEDPDHLRALVFELKKKESKLSQELRELEPAIRRLQNDYSRLKAESDAKEAIASGYTRAVGAILEARDHGTLRGICGTIAELAQVDPKYEVALEVAAGGGRMQAIVTETDEDAAMAIDFLKRNRLGRATFLPLNKMSPGRPAGRPLMAVRSPDAEGFAIDIIRFDERYHNAFWYVFRDTVVVKSLEAARKLMGGVRLVTLEGDLIDAGGAMTGGDKAAASAGKLKFGATEAAQFEDISKRLRMSIAHQEALSVDLQGVRAELEDAESRLRDASASTSERNTKLQEITRRKAELDAKVQALLHQQGQLTLDMKAVDAEIGDHEKAVARLTTQLGEMERERDDKAQHLLNATPKDLARELEREERLAGQLRETTRDLTSQLETKEHSLQLLAERKAEIEARLAEIDGKLTRYEAEVKTNAALSKAKEQELSVLLALDAQHDEAVRELTGERDRLNDERRSLESMAEKLRDRRQAKEDIILHQQMRVPAIEAALQEVRDELALFTHELPVQVDESLDELRQRIRRYENQLEALGNVNMLALEEYDRQAARKTELVEETGRLEQERGDLITLVDEIVAKKKEGFFKVYDEINQNFTKVYERLSAGGKAELILENPEHPFEGGLTMRAQPPGKKVTRLEALSGGEKGLTSMAFIFAIQEFDPSPFYYLDEVDQNLDGINSELLARMVKQESKHAQFIVVSLRKVTLKEAEHVYGVTMMESGLSEIIGEVRISELADEPPAAAKEAAAQ